MALFPNVNSPATGGHGSGRLMGHRGDNMGKIKVKYCDTEIYVPVGTSIAEIKYCMSNIYPELKNAHPMLEGDTIRFRLSGESRSIDCDYDDSESDTADVADVLESLTPKKEEKKEEEVDPYKLPYVIVYISPEEKFRKLYTDKVTEAGIRRLCSEMVKKYTHIHIETDQLKDTSNKYYTSLYVIRGEEKYYSGLVTQQARKFLTESLNFKGQYVIATGEAMKKCGTSGSELSYYGAGIVCEQVLDEVDLAIVRVYHQYNNEYSEPILVDANEIKLKNN